MTGSRPAEIMRRLEQSGLAADGPAATDAELLARFARQRDQAAFALLVRRHGPMVLAVCRRVTFQPHDAEDAFQAIFLVLARRAAAITRPELLGNWLYGVAVRVAQKARRTAARRRAREVQVADMPEPVDPSTRDLTVLGSQADIGPVLHEELAGLAAWYREPIVLCDLRGVSRAEAAKALGIPEGTLSSRLANGRKKLAERLARRGVAMAAVAVPTVLGEGHATAGVPEELVMKTCGLVADWSAGVVVPGAVAKLAEGGLSVRTMLLLGVVTMALTAAGVVLATSPTNPPQPNDPPKPPDAPVAKANPERVPEPAPIVEQKPDEKPAPLGAPRLRKAIDLPVPRLSGLAWAPDGKGLAIQDTSKRAPGMPEPQLLYIPDVTAAQLDYRWIDLAPPGTLVGFTPDGKAILTAVREYGLVSGFHRLDVWPTDPAKPGVPAAAPMGGGGAGVFGGDHVLKPARAINLDPDRTFGYAFASDGKTFRTVYLEFRAPGILGVLEAREVSMETGKTTKTLARVEGEFVNYALAPDGKQLATFDKNEAIAAHDTETGKQLWQQTPKFDRIEGSSGIGGSREQRATLQYSADGKQLVYTADFTRPIVFDARTGEARPLLDNTSLLRALAAPGCFSHDGRLLALSGDRFVARESKRDFGGGKGPTSYSAEGQFLTVWNIETRKVVKSWDQKATVRFLPNRPILAVFEENHSGGTRLGLWDFAAEATEKK